MIRQVPVIFFRSYTQLCEACAYEMIFESKGLDESFRSAQPYYPSNLKVAGFGRTLLACAALLLLNVGISSDTDSVISGNESTKVRIGYYQFMFLQHQECSLRLVHLGPHVFTAQNISCDFDQSSYPIHLVPLSKDFSHVFCRKAKLKKCLSNLNCDQLRVTILISRCGQTFLHGDQLHQDRCKSHIWFCHLLVL